MENFTAYVSKRKEENQPDSKFDGWLNPKINPGWIITGHQGGSISPQKAHKHSLLKPNMGHSLTKNGKNIIFFCAFTLSTCRPLHQVYFEFTCSGFTTLQLL